VGPVQASVVVAAALLAGVTLVGCGTGTEVDTGLPAAAGQSGAAATHDTEHPRSPAASESRPTTRHGDVGESRQRRPLGSDDWRLEHSGHAGRQIEAYTTRSSGVPGTRVGLKVSTRAGHFRVWAYRIGSYPGGWGELVWRSTLRRGRLQAEPRLDPVETRTVVAHWRSDLTVDTTGWRPGFYVFKLRTGSGWDMLAPYVVSSPSAVGTVALVAPVTTWQAYNRWGGYSLYEGSPGDRRSWAVSFDRPYNGATGANDYRTAAFPVVVRAEQLGVALSYFTNVDLDARPGVLSGARGYVSLGHDEYWTPGMRREVLGARDSGTNLAFLGANTMYWRVRLADRATGPDRLLVGYRDDAWRDPLRDERPAQTTGRFRDPPAARPENDLVGMAYECYPVDADYRVVSPGWWGFRDTGMRYGDTVRGLVGPEADRVYPNRAAPRPLQILSHTTYPCRGVPTSSQSVYYTTPVGSGVFAAGTLRWGCALIDACDHPLGAQASRFVRVVTGNVVRAFAAGPVGERHPARDNVADYDLAAVNSVPAS
jgi:hypothetical protein